MNECRNELVQKHKLLKFSPNRPKFSYLHNIINSIRQIHIQYIYHIINYFHRTMETDDQAQGAIIWQKIQGKQIQQDIDSEIIDKKEKSENLYQGHKNEQQVAQKKEVQNKEVLINTAQNRNRMEEKEKILNKDQESQIQKLRAQREFRRIFLWLDPSKNEKQQKRLQKVIKIKKFTKLQECLEFIRKPRIGHISVICAGSIAEALLREINEHKYTYIVKYVFIFCFDVQEHRYLKNYQIVQCVENDTENLLAVINNTNQSYEQPNFRKFEDDKQKCMQLKYSYYTAYLSSPVNDIHIRELLAYRFKSSIQRYFKKLDIDFDFQYPLQFNTEQIVKLYTGDYIYKYLNRLMKTDLLEQLENGHIMIADLHQSINQFSAFEYRCKIPSVLYRGCLLTQTQLDQIPQYIGTQIQFLSFLSTSMDPSVCERFRRNNIFTIYIPTFFKNKQSINLNIRGGYTDVERFQPYFCESQVIFNIKTKMTLFRISYGADNITDVQLIYGLDQMICWLQQNSKKFYVHKLRAEERKDLRNKCKKKCKQKLHFIGASSQKIKCLTELTQNDLLYESFILINSKVVVTGMVVQYDQDVKNSLAAKRLKQTKNSQKLCKLCRATVKCQQCNIEQCLCKLPNHNPSHLQKYHILVEGEVPRFISTDLNQARLNMYRTNEQIQKTIACKADAMLMTKDQKFMIEAEKQYDAEINSQEFKQLDYRVQYKRLFCRGQSRRLKLYVLYAKVKDEQLQKSLSDYQRCYQLVIDKSNEIRRQTMALHHIGIVEDDLKRYDQSLEKYNQSLSLLENYSKNNILTDEETSVKISIINCKAFYYIHKSQLQTTTSQLRDKLLETAIDLYGHALSDLKLLKRNTVQDQAKFLNNLAQCLNYSKKYVQAVETGKRSYDLRLKIFGSEHTLTKASQKNYLEAKEALEKK